MKLWSTLEAPIKRLGRWNFSSFAVERVSRKHREVETWKRKKEGVTKQQERKSGQGEREKENVCGIATYRRFRVGTDLPRSPTPLVFEWFPAIRLYGENSTADKRNAIALAWSAFIIVTAKVDEITYGVGRMLRKKVIRVVKYSKFQF